MFIFTLLAPKDEGCKSDSECASTESCRNRHCINPCVDGNPCARTAQCLAQNHKAICSCPIGMIGDPFSNCYNEPRTTGCTHNSECQNSYSCINRKCQNPCLESNPCAENAECRVSNNRPLCYCPSGWGGDPHVRCYKRKYYGYYFSILSHSC